MKEQRRAQTFHFCVIDAHRAIMVGYRRHHTTLPTAVSRESWPAGIGFEAYELGLRRKEPSWCVLRVVVIVTVPILDVSTENHRHPRIRLVIIQNPESRIQNICALTERGAPSTLPFECGGV